MIRRGDVFFVDFPFTDVRASKARAAVVVQHDVDEDRRRKTLVTSIASNLRKAHFNSGFL
jgi:mRNA-degrading endonuclease toxin of MazEF toxin-antitoxin module